MPFFNKLLLTAILFIPAISRAQDSLRLRINPQTRDTVIIENPFYNTPGCVYIEQMPEAGYDVNAFIAKNIRYPKDAYDAGIEGRVNVQFKVSEQGFLDSFKVLKPVYPSLDSEALRVVKLLPQPWKSGKMAGKSVPVKYTLPIRICTE